MKKPASIELTWAYSLAANALVAIGVKSFMRVAGMSRSTGIMAIHYCTNCKILYSAKLPELPKQPLAEFNELQGDREMRRALWQKEVKQLTEGPKLCYECGAMTGRTASLIDSKRSKGFLLKDLISLKKKTRKMILDLIRKLPRSSYHKVHSRVYWATLFLEQPDCLVDCPRGMKRKIKLYQMGWWD